MLVFQDAICSLLGNPDRPKSQTEYIRHEWVSDLRRQIRNYKHLKKLSGEWITLSIEHSRLTMKPARSR
jgi:hypothetical protein